jgi:hypothetical protein
VPATLGNLVLVADIVKTELTTQLAQCQLRAVRPGASFSIRAIARRERDALLRYGERICAKRHSPTPYRVLVRRENTEQS